MEMSEPVRRPGEIVIKRGDRGSAQLCLVLISHVHSVSLSIRHAPVVRVSDAPICAPIVRADHIAPTTPYAACHIRRSAMIAQLLILRWIPVVAVDELMAISSDPSRS
jgi:hypothetical protein